MAITLLELKTQSRYKADMENSGFISDTELLSYINSSIAELHDLLVTVNGADYFLTSSNIVGNGTDSYNLPADFYKLRGVDAKLGTDDWTTLRPFNFNERNKFTTLANLHGIASMRYRIQGSKIYFSPAPDSNTIFKLWYTPMATKLEDDSDELSDLNQFAEYVTVDVAIKMLLKEESDVSVLLSRKEELKRRILESAQNRDSSEGIAVTDVYQSNDYYKYRGEF